MNNREVEVLETRGAVKIVDRMPECDVCFVQKVRRPAWADAKIPGTCWWYLCREHFDHYRCAIGNGKGYLLEERAPEPLI